jgi:hypothetical protein
LIHSSKNVFVEKHFQWRCAFRTAAFPAREAHLI